MFRTEESHYFFSTSLKSPFATRVRRVASHVDRKDMPALLGSHSHGSAEAVHSYAAPRTHLVSLWENMGDEKAERAQHIWSFDWRLQKSVQLTLSTLVVSVRHNNDEDSRISTV